MCLSNAKAAGYGEDMGPVSYLYQWGHVGLWVMGLMLLLPCFYTMIFTSRSMWRVFVDDESQINEEDVVCERLKEKVGTFGDLYGRLVLLDLLTLLVHAMIFVVMDLLFLNGNTFVILRSFPWTRDVEGFTDVVSLAFPSFLSCSFTPETHVFGMAGVYYGCFHKAATLYAASFLALALTVLCTSLVTLMHLLYLVLYVPMPWGRHSLVTSGFKYGDENLFKKEFDLGDLLFLEFSKNYVNGRQYASVFKYIKNYRFNSRSTAIVMEDIVELSESN